WRVAWVVAFPLLYLLVAVPFGNFLIAPLQDLTAVFVVKGLRLIEIPVYLDGIFLSIPAARFEVAEACAGVRFLIATIALGLLFGHLTYRSRIRFAAFMMLSVAVPLVANWFRALGIVYLAHITDAEVAIGADHIIYGWAFFSFVTIVLLSIGMMMREKAPAIPHPETAVRAAPVGIPGSPTLIAGVAVISLLIAFSAPAYERFTRPDDPDTRAPKLNLPEIGGGWRLAAGVPPGWRPSFSSADATLLRTYVKDGRKVQFFIAYYARQAQGREVVTKANMIADGKAWYRAANWSTTVEVDGVPVGVKATRMLRGDRRRLALSWYWVGGSFTNNPYISKLLQIRSRLFGGPDAAAVIAVSATYEHVPREAEVVLRNFLSNTTSLRQALEHVSQN
ncbi:MAG: EpsI family protein, partial [Gammaproteobacteria bacterium]|nr:EpsI family protein [Gammaproteobacteria bacterium]